MKVITLPEKILRQKSIAVQLPLSKNDRELAEKLIKYLNSANNPDNNLRPGVGISAVQLGYLKRMFYVQVDINEFDTFEELLINPVIISESKEYAALKSGEGCLSIKEEEDRQGLVHRKNKITIKGYSFLKQKQVTWNLEGYLAIVFQHEYDHLEGKLYIDRIDYLKPDEVKKNEIIVDY